MGQVPPHIRKARVLRRWATTPEDTLWQALRNRKLAGLKFRRKAPVGPHVVDFLCPGARLIVEVTGKAQDARILEARDLEFIGLGFGLLRLNRQEIETDLAQVLSRIRQAASMRL